MVNLSRTKVPAFFDMCAQRVRVSGFARIRRYLAWPVSETEFRNAMEERGIAVRASSRVDNEFDLYDCAVIR